MAETEVVGGAGSRLLPYIGKVEVARKVHIYSNGDKFFAGKNFVLNPRQLRSFDAFLNEVTTALKPNFGAVRTIRTPNQGHRVDDLAALESGKSYVASGAEKFVNIGYDQIVTLGQKPGNAAQAQSPRESVLRRKIQVSGRIKKVKLEPIAVYVYANGESQEPPKRLLIQPWIERDWQAVLALANEKVKLLSGAVRRLYELDSKQEVVSVKELKNEGSYVAAAKERFKDAQYGVSNGVLSPSLQQKRRHPHLAPLKKKSPHASSSDIATSAAASTALSGSGQSDNGAASSDSKGTVTSGDGSPEATLKPHPPKAPRKQNAANADSTPPARNKGGIYVRPLKHKRELAKDKVVDLDKDDGGLYKAKNAGAGGAETVDDAGAQTEVPVDERKAEEVAEDPREVLRARLRRRRERIRKRRIAAAAARVREALLHSAASKIQAAVRSFLRRKAEAKRQYARMVQAKLESARRTAAAVQIQAAYRGHRTREQLREQRRAEKLLEAERQAAAADAAVKIQATYRGHRARADVRPQLEERRRRKQEEEDEERRRRAAAAAVKIQSSYRGHRARVDLARRREEKAAAERRAAAVRIQAAYRGHRTRAELRDAERQRLEAAATKIQAVYRGHRSRLQASELRREEAGRETAALKIQATYRGHRTRLAARQQRAQQNSAAVKIQAAFRGRRERKKLKEQPRQQQSPPPPQNESTDEIRNAAATKIQAVYRGHRARAAAETQRLALAHAVRRHVAVVQIQGAYRKYRSRRQRRAEREDRARKAAAATTIQSAFRGHRVRKSIAVERAGDGAAPTAGDRTKAGEVRASSADGDASARDNTKTGAAESSTPSS